MVRVWVLRNEFEVAARSPALLNLSGVLALVLMESVLLHWLLLTVDKRLPCSVIFWISHSGKAKASSSFCRIRFSFE